MFKKLYHKIKLTIAKKIMQRVMQSFVNDFNSKSDKPFQGIPFTLQPGESTTIPFVKIDDRNSRRIEAMNYLELAMSVLHEDDNMKTEISIILEDEIYKKLKEGTLKNSYGS